MSQTATAPARASSPALSDFDAARYLRSNTDVRDAGVDPLRHWIDHGRDEERSGLRPNWRLPRFAAKLYLEHNVDVRDRVASGDYTSPADHWYRTGRHEAKQGQRNCGAFDEAAYLERRPDVAASIKRGGYVSGLDHWLSWGQSEDEQAGAPVSRRPAEKASDGVLSAEKQAFWNENGFLVLEGLISPERCDSANARIDQMWTRREEDPAPVSIDAFLERPDYARLPMPSVPMEARSYPYKINDMFLYDEMFRELALDPGLVKALRWVLGSPPCVINSLNFERGSTQNYHTDTLYMPGPKPGDMTATWFALEDVTPEAGPLTYYPGSHVFPLFHFSTGRSNQVFEELSQYEDYMQDQVDRLRLVPTVFLPKKGDVLIWHERLYHGGSKIVDMIQTRRSYVCHYWNADIMPADQIKPYGDGYYFDRPY